MFALEPCNSNQVYTNPSFGAWIRSSGWSCVLHAQHLTLDIPQLCWKPVPCQQTQSAATPRANSWLSPHFSSEKEKKYYHGLGHDSWETPCTPCHPCPGTVNSSRERAGSWGHRHLKIAAMKTPEFKSTSSWWFQQTSPSKAKSSTWEMPNFSEGWWYIYNWWHWSQQLKISRIIP